MSTNYTFGAKQPQTTAFGPPPLFSSPQQQGNMQFGNQQPVASTAPSFAPTTSGAFQFSSPTTAAFGTTPFGLNTSSAQPNLKQGGFSFKVPTSMNTLFPSSTTTPSFFSASTPTPVAASAGMQFNTTQPQQVGFGAKMPSGLTFNVPPNTTAAVPGAKLNFLMPTTAQATSGFAYGSKPTTSIAPQMPFGATTTSAGLTFGTPLARSMPVATANMSTPRPTFGAPMTTLNFNSPTTGTSLAAPIQTTTSTNLTFGKPTPTTASLFSIPTTTTTPSFSLTTTASFNPTTTMSLANFGGLTSTAAPAINFGQGPSATTTATSGGLSFGFGGLPSTTATPVLSAFSRTLQPTSTTATSRPVGLGGVVSTLPKLTTTGAGQADVPPKDQVLPNELMQTVEHFKKFLQEQKSHISEVARFPIKDLRQVESDIEKLNNFINEMTTELQKNSALVHKLKFEVAKDLQYVEMAQRTFDTPSGLQYSNQTPFTYFVDLCNHFEGEMHTLKAKIEHVERHVRNSGPPTELSSEDLALGIHRLHNAFVALAGRLQTLHNQVEYQKEQYLNLRRHILKDNRNVFDETPKDAELFSVALKTTKNKVPEILSGPTPFTMLGNSQAQVMAQNQATGYSLATPIGITPTTAFNTTGLNNNLFGNSPSTQASMFAPSTSNAFQLQKPPVGNKRGKSHALF